MFRNNYLFKLSIARFLAVVLALLSSHIFGKEMQISVLTDSSGSVTIEEVVNKKFLTIEGTVVNFPISDFIRWIKIDLDDVDEDECLLLEKANLDSISLFQISEGVLMKIISSGESIEFEDRNMKIADFGFLLEPTDEATTLYLRVISGKQISVPVSILTEQMVIAKQHRKDIFFAIYTGIFLVMILYNLFLWLTVKDRDYIYYVFFILSVGLTQLALNGYGQQYLWPTNTWFAVRATNFFGILSGLGTILFSLNYLRTKEYSLVIHKLILGFVGLYLLGGFFTFLGHLVLGFNLINLCALASLLLVIAALKAYRKGYRPAGFFIVAFLIFLVGVTAFALKEFGVLPHNDFTAYSLPIGSALEIILLSFALADRINQLKREKEIEQEEKLLVLGENERIIKQQNAMLEAKVGERTRELATANAELSTTLDNLKAAQAQLVDAEKMASLGQMTAGIAHELNNPINFVSGNISPLKRDIEDLLSVIGKYEEVEPNDESAPAKITEAKDLARQLDVPFIREEIQQLLKGIEVGASRTSAIVRGLRVFSRLDEDALKKADINECVISTIIILKSNFRGEVMLQEDLDPNLKEIMCFPGKLNQVFMNILNNAVQATGGQGRKREERIVSIATKQKERGIEIRIKDNGTGMPEEVKNKIFDPFFTTKGVGEGTGLGLSIVLGIINDHKGTIDVVTKEGEGTEFIINLPDNLS